MADRSNIAVVECRGTGQSVPLRDVSKCTTPRAWEFRFFVGGGSRFCCELVPGSGGCLSGGVW